MSRNVQWWSSKADILPVLVLFLTLRLSYDDKYPTNTVLSNPKLHSLQKIINRYSNRPKVFDKFLLTPIRYGNVI